VRIERLDLLAFGPFTKARLSFEDKPTGLQLIYGPNEAGKSSSLRAIVELLFGFQNRTNDDFLHPYAKLRVGAKLAFPDQTTLSIVRRKAAKNTLRDENDDAVVDESMIQTHLAKVDRELFRHMFGIDHQSLRAGGREMVEGNGKVGETLFSAAAGISKLRTAQKSLLAQADELFKATAKSSKIRKLVDEYQELKKHQADSLVAAEIWKSRGENLARLLEKQTKLQATLTELTKRESWIQRVIDSSNPIAQLKQAKSTLKALQHVPVLPENFGIEAGKLLEDWRAFQTKIDQIEESLKQIEKELESITDSTHWISCQTEIEVVLEEYGTYKSAMADRPTLEGERSVKFMRMQNILRGLGLPTENPDIESLRLPSDKLVRIRELGNQREGLFEKLQSLQREHATIVKDIEKARSQQNTIAPRVGWEVLEAKLRQHRSDSDLEEDLAQFDSEINLIESEIKDSLQRLKLAHVDAAKISTLSVISDASLHEFEEQFRALEKRKAKLADQIQESESEESRLEHELALLETERTIPSESELTRLRAERDFGWQLISRILANESVSESDLQKFLSKATFPQSLSIAFEAYLSATDSLADDLRWHADKVTAKSRILAEVARNRKKIKKLQTEDDRLTQEQQALAANWKNAWSPTMIEPHPPSQMRDWLDDFDSVRKQNDALATKVLQRTKLATKLESLSKEFHELLAKIDGNSFESDRSLNELFQYAEKVVGDCKDKQSRQTLIEESLAQDSTRLLDCEIDLAQANDEWKKWQADWSAEMQRIRLEEDAIPAQANVVLQELQELFQFQEEYQNLSRRIDGIDRNATNFTERLHQISHQLLVPFSNQTIEQSIRLLRMGFEQAVSAETKRKTLLETRKKQLANKQSMVDQRNVIASHLNDRCKQAQCTEPHQLPALVAEAAKKSSIEQAVDELEKHLITLARNQSLDEFLLAFDEEAPRFDEFPLELDAIRRDLVTNRQEYDHTLQEIKSAKDELNRIDGSAKAAEFAEKMQNLASEIEDACLESVKLRLASSMLAKAMEKYREKNQGPVLGLASDFFSRMTLENYRSIQAEFDDQGNPSLVGVRRDGTHVAVNGMSDGTCDQLFLALRLASLKIWLDKHPPIPFIVDDILVHFDEERAQATLKVLHDFSNRTQVLFFTHHEHTLRLAESVLTEQELQIIRLPNRQSM
jgi:uncharacterized protein YhaN